jgi:transposase-like protein
MAKSHTLCLYLAKADVGKFEVLLTPNARDLVKQGIAKASAAADFADGSMLYTFPGHPTVPRWALLLRTSFEVPPDLFSQSPCGLLIFKKDISTFALTFSYAHVYLNDAMTESDFGLKVAINAVSDTKLRSIERSNIGVAETVRFWWNRFGPMFAAEIRKKRVAHTRGYPQWRWHLDEAFVKVNGKLCYLWRAVDHEGEVLEAVVTAKRDKAAALKFLKRIMKTYGRPQKIVTDGLCSYSAAMKEIGIAGRQEVGRGLNNRAENSHHESAPCSAFEA